MKRRQLVFVSVVYSIVVTGFILERQRNRDLFDFGSITSIGSVDLPPVDLPAANESLEGSVVDENGQALQDVGVHLYRADRARPNADSSPAAEPLLWTRTDANGRFQIVGAPSGDYEVALLAIGRPATKEQISLPTAAPVLWRMDAASSPPTVLAEIEMSSLEGRLAPPVGSLPTPHPVDGYEVWFEPVGAEESWLEGRVPRRVTVQATGHFDLPDLVSGRYLVRVLPSWAAGGTWPILEEIAYTHPGPSQLDPGASPPHLSLRLRSGTLGGHAYDEKGLPLEGALVKIWPADRPDRLWPTLATDESGTFLVRDLPPGPYRVRLRAGSAEFESDVTIRIGARTPLTPPPLNPNGTRN